MAEMRTIECPVCEKANQPRAMVDGIEEFRCASCGLVYYGPCGCDTVHEERPERLAVAVGAASAPTLAEGWQMSTPPVPLENGAAVRKFPGCS